MPAPAQTKGHSRGGPRALIATAVLLALGGRLEGASAVDAAAPKASASLQGASWYATPSKQRFTILAALLAHQHSRMSGGSASFGAMDSGEIVWVTHAAYLPSLNPAISRRVVKTPTPPLGVTQMPRFLMVCSWPVVDGKPGPPIAGYAERDDASMSVREGTYYVTLSAQWVAVPALRAAAKFAARDHCGEVAASQRSSVPRWLMDDDDARR